MTRDQKQIQIVLPAQSEWGGFLREFFEETSAAVHVSTDALQASRDFDRLRPDVVFYTPEFLAQSLVQKWKAHCALSPNSRFFQLGAKSKTGSEDFKPDALFPAEINLIDFQREIVKYLPYPETLSVLITDDEEEIGAMIRDYLSYHSAPAFQVDYRANGVQALEYLKNKHPDVLVMDVKMPGMGGIEVYRTLKETGLDVPVIIFFDAVFGDEIEKLQAIGSPAIIEKGGRQSAMPGLLALIKKKAFFG